MKREAFAEEADEKGKIPEEENLAWEELYTEHLVQDEWIDFRRSAFRFPDGSVFEPYYSYSRKDYVVIVATDQKGDYLCVRQYRQGIREVTTEFPAGGIEKKDDSTQKAGSADAEEEIRKTAFEAARRELLEETGYESEEWQFLMAVPSNATLADNYAYIFRAKNCRKFTEQKLDETEFLNVMKHSKKEIMELIQTGKFQQAVHIMALLYSDAV